MLRDRRIQLLEFDLLSQLNAYQHQFAKMLVEQAKILNAYTIWCNDIFPLLFIGHQQNQHYDFYFEILILQVDEE